MFNALIEFIREIYKTNEYIPLHEPNFLGKEREYVLDTIDSTFVSSVGEYVNIFEERIAEYTGVNHAIATVNGTSSLHSILSVLNISNNDLVITQSLTFVATVNSILYSGATPVFLDVERDTLSLSPVSLGNYLSKNCEVRDDMKCWDIKENKIVKACIPMHTLGFPAELNEIKKICDDFNIVMIEDAAESLGSYYDDKHTGSVGSLSALSFNGNKIITTGGGGMILTNDKKLADEAKHLTTTAKINNGWIWEHDRIGYNYRMPNINAALGLAQIEYFDTILDSKRSLAKLYRDHFEKTTIEYIDERENTKANFWLNSVITKSKDERDKLLVELNDARIGARPLWRPIHELNLSEYILPFRLVNTDWLYNRVISLPSTPILK